MSGEFWVGPRSDPDTYRLVSLIGGGGEPGREGIGHLYSIAGDQRPLASGSLTLGQVDVDVTGLPLLRLSINNPVTIRDGCRDQPSSAAVVFGDAGMVP